MTHNPAREGYLIFRATFSPKQRRILRGQPQTIFRPERIEATPSDPFVIHRHGSIGAASTLCVGDFFEVDVENTSDQTVRLNLMLR